MGLETGGAQRRSLGKGKGPARANRRPQVAHKYAMWDAAYVLGALSDVDRRELEAYMLGCISCREAVTELTAVS